MKIIIATLFLTGTVWSLLYAGPTHAELAQHWAPVIYHDTNDSYGYDAEYITNVDFDGNWSGTDNWENLYYYDLPAYVYYSVTETTTHWFINYNAFHPRDDGPSGDQHENDFEGGLLMIRKDGSYYGRFELMLTLAHDQIYQYTNESFQTAEDDVDDGVLFDGHRPLSYIQANGFSGTGNGHGWKGYNGDPARGGDGIVYYYGGWAEFPDDGTGDFVNEYSYDLKSMDELWSRRFLSELFYDFGVMRGDTHKDNAVKMPWYWDDGDDGPVFNGAMWSDPAHMVDTHLTNLGSFSRTYVSNNNYTHKVEISQVISLDNRDSFGGKSDIYVKVYVDGTRYWDDRLGKRNNANKGSVYYPAMGRDNASVDTYDGYTNDIFIAKPAGSQVVIEVWDSDTGNDDFMGSIAFTLQAGQSRSGYQQTTSNGDARVTYNVSCVQ